MSQAYKTAMATVAPYFTQGQVAAQPYSSLTANEKSEIVKAAYDFRNSLINAKNKLNIV